MRSRIARIMERARHSFAFLKKTLALCQEMLGAGSLTDFLFTDLLFGFIAGRTDKMSK
jgi:hypothetical protein